MYLLPTEKQMNKNHSVTKTKIVRMCFKLIYSLFTKRKLIGEENLPTSGGCILVVNHMSLADAPLLLTLIRHPKLSGFVAKKYQNNAFFRSILNWAASDAGGIIWVKRGNADRKALFKALKAVKSGVMLGIAPEGTRSNTGSLQKPKPGIAFLASKANVPIIPAVIIGTDKTFTNIKRIKRTQLILKIGPAFHLDPIQRSERRIKLDQYTEEIMLRLAALLPEENRGVYANHPKLKLFIEWANKSYMEDNN